MLATNLLSRSRPFTPYLCLFYFLILSSCSSNQNEVLLHGQWKTVKWEEEKTGKTYNSIMDFEFLPSGEYTIDYGSEKEHGKYWITADYLHTVENGQSEKSVRVLKITKDSFQFQMNRAGTLENVLLLKATQ